MLAGDNRGGVETKTSDATGDKASVSHVSIVLVNTGPTSAVQTRNGQERRISIGELTQLPLQVHFGVTQIPRKLIMLA
jgi:hypothetical protein